MFDNKCPQDLMENVRAISRSNRFDDTQRHSSRARLVVDYVGI